MKKILTSRAFALRVVQILCLLTLFLSPRGVLSQAPSISYPGPQTFVYGKPIPPVPPTVTGGVVVTPGTYADPYTVFNSKELIEDITTNGQSFIFSEAPGNTVYSLPITGGTLPTAITSINVNTPTGVAMDNSGDLFVAYLESHEIVEYFPNNTGSVVLTTNLTSPWGIAYYNNYIYVADLDAHAVKRVPVSGGPPVVVSSGLTAPTGVAVNQQNGDLYVVDNDLIYVTVYPAGGGASTQLGTGLHNAWGICCDASMGKIWVADKGNDVIKCISITDGSQTNIGPGATNALRLPNTVTTEGNGIIDVLDRDPSSNAVAIKRFLPITNYSYSISPALPAGLSIDSQTGVISGTPGVSTGLINYTVTIANSQASSSTTLTIEVKPVPVINYSSPQVYNVAAPITPLAPTSSNVNSPVYKSAAAVGWGFSSPTGVASDVNGNVFITDASNNVVKEILSTDGTVMIVGKGFKGPHGIAADAQGNLYVADYGNNAVKEITLSGSTYTGQTTLGSGFLNPVGVAVDGVGNVYVADYGNNAIKKIPAGGGVTVALGSGFIHPTGVAVDGAGNVYVADWGNKAVKKIPAGGGATITLSSGLNSPYGIALDASGNIFVADNVSNIVQLIPPNGGSPTTALTGFSGPTGLVIDATGNIFVADQLNNGVKEISPAGGYYVDSFLPPGLAMDNNTGVISGTPSAPYPAKNYRITGYNAYGSASQTVNISVLSPAPAISYNTPVNYMVAVPITPLSPVNTGNAVSPPGYNTATTAVSGGFSYPDGVAVDAAGNVYVADNLHFNVKMIPGGTGTATVIGSGFKSPVGVAVDASGNVYVADLDYATIKKIPAGNGAVVDVGSGFSSPWGVAVDAAGNIYVGDTGNGSVKKIPAAGGAPVVLASGFNQPMGVAVDAQGNVFVAESGNNVVREIPVGGGPVTSVGSGFNAPAGVAIDAGGNLFIADQSNNAIKVIYSGQTTPVTIGSGFSFPVGVAFDSLGNVYVGDNNHSSVKKISPVGGYYISPALPQGLNFDGATGVISGTPSAVASTTSYKITGYDASAGSTATANIFVNYNLDLSSLVVSAGTLNPAFTSSVINYSDYISGKVSSVTFTPTTIDPEATVSINGVNVPSRTASPPISLSGASNTVSIVVSAAGFAGTHIFTVKLIPPLPAISYTSPVTYPPGAAITPLAPTSTYVAAEGYAGGRTSITSAVTNPTCLAVDPSGNLFIGSVNGASLTEIPAGGGAPVPYSSGFSSERGMATDAAGNIYVADFAAVKVIKIPAGGGTPVSIGSGFTGPWAVATDIAGNVYVADRGSNTVKKIQASDGTTVTIATGFNTPSGIAADAQGNIYLADSGTNSVKKIPAGGGSIVSVGTGHSGPFGLAVDPSGNLFIAESGNGRVMEITAAGAQIFLASGFLLNTGVAISPQGVVYMTDSGQNIVFSVKPSGGYHLSAYLPAGLSFNDNTGIISGIPAGTAPAANYTVTGYNLGGSGSAVVNIGISSAPALSALALSDGALSPAFAYNITSYTAAVGNGVTSITVTPAVSSAGSTITVNGTAVTSGTASSAINLNIGANTINIVVTAHDGVTKQTYVLTVTRAASANASLTTMGSSIAPLTPAFTPNTTSYTLSVANTTTSMTVTPVTSDANATMKVNGTTLASGTKSAPIPLAVGSNTINVVVTAANGTTVKTYTITVTRAGSSNAGLSAMNPQYGPLSPVFNINTTSYTVSVANSKATFTVAPVTSDATATMKVNGTTLASGSASAPIPLGEGTTTAINVAVTAQDGTTTKTYTIVVTRAPSPVGTLAGLSLSAGVMSPAFATATTSYTSSEVNSVSSVTVTPTATDANASITVNGSAVASGSPSGAITLAEGVVTNISVIVTSQDGSNTKTYIIAITRAKSSDATLASMNPQYGPLSPVFTSGATWYTEGLPYSKSSMTVAPVTANANATIKVNGTALVSGATSAPVVLAEGGTTNINVVVTAQDGTTTKTYTIAVTRGPSADANLSAMNPQYGPLSPVFSANTTSYGLSVANTKTTITVAPVTTDANATIKVNGTTLASGTTSAPIPLAAGATTNITVVVTAQDGATTKTYTIVVTRAAGGADAFDPISVNRAENNVILNGDGIKVHQGISPNGDGIEDFLQVDNISLYPDNKLSIMNRNGQLIYQAKGYDNASHVFDGHSSTNGRMQLPGTYFYQLDYMVDGVIKHRAGFIVLKY